MKKLRNFLILAAVALGVSFAVSNITVKWEEPRAAACQPGVDC